MPCLHRRTVCHHLSNSENSNPLPCAWPAMCCLAVQVCLLIGLPATRHSCYCSSLHCRASYSAGRCLTALPPLMSCIFSSMRFSKLQAPPRCLPVVCCLAVQACLLTTLPAARHSPYCGSFHSRASHLAGECLNALPPLMSCMSSSLKFITLETRPLRLACRVLLGRAGMPAEWFTRGAPQLLLQLFPLPSTTFSR